MIAHVLRGSRQEIAEGLARIKGEIREAIIFAEESQPIGDRVDECEDMFLEMIPFMVDADWVNDSREAIYTRAEDE